VRFKLPGFVHVVSNIEFELKISFVSADLQRFHGNDGRGIEGPNEFVPAYTQLAPAGLDLVILHSPGFIGYSAVYPVALDRDRGGDVAHIAQ
jgi:hypothetical protein